MKVEQNNDNLTERFMSIQRHNPGAHALLKSKTNDYINMKGFVKTGKTKSEDYTIPT